MLDQIRRRKDSVATSILVLATAAVMAMYGVGKFGGKSDPSTQVAAWVNGQRITVLDFRRALGQRVQQFQMFFGGNLDERMLAQLHIPEQVLKDLVDVELLKQEARRAKWWVGDLELASTIRSLPQYQEKGVFDAAAYRALPNRGLEEKKMREQLLIQRWENFIHTRLEGMPEDKARSDRLDAIKIDLEYALIDFSDQLKGQQPSVGDLERGGRQISQADLASYYQSHIQDFTRKAQRHVRLIKVGIPFHATEAQKKASHTKAAQVVERLAHSTFAQVAKQYSEDSSAKNGGDAGWLAEGTLEPAVEKALESMSLGSTSSAIESPFGIYFVQLLEKKPAVIELLAEKAETVRTRVAEMRWREEREKEMLKEWNARLKRAGSLKGELNKYHIPLKSTGIFALSASSIPSLGDSPVVWDAVFALNKEHPVVPELLPQGNKYLYLTLKKVVPASAQKKKAGTQKEPPSRDGSANFQLAAESDVLKNWVDTLRMRSSVKMELKFDTTQNKHDQSED